METKHISHFISNNSTEFFGLLPDGDVVQSCKLQNKNGIELQVITFGAALASLKIPLEKGGNADVVLGFDTLADYLSSFDLDGAPYFGATVGRYAGRIAKGVFTLNEKKIQLAKNNGENALHGGLQGFSQKVWEIIATTQGDNPSVTLKLLSPDNDENFPGALTVEVKYTLSEENELIIEYKATTTEDTIINLTHHSYFNLDGHKSSTTDQELVINSRRMLETRADNIPTGSITDVKGGLFDFNMPKKCPTSIDNTFVLEQNEEFAACLSSNKNNLKMTVYTDQPAVHIYVGGNCGDNLKGKDNVNYHALSGICFETQNFPDAPNHKNFPTPILKKEAIYQHKTIYKFQSI
ncbi:aldose epimerase family protein [Flavobacterium algicola]|uniref:aldose epimerase family protein n=1 Tax=Flavobacterium algicola TaxID=556529 RepID=UPI001EFE7E40|nr:aldose epimerase family protein [Flavobacterium algicola]MCG9792274.1 galactose mutarotase [Flavobacterium algicola]